MTLILQFLPGFLYIHLYNLANNSCGSLQLSVLFSPGNSKCLLFVKRTKLTLSMIFDSLIFILNPAYLYMSCSQMEISVLGSLGVSHSTFSSLFVSKRKKNKGNFPTLHSSLVSSGMGVVSVNKDKSPQTIRS